MPLISRSTEVSACGAPLPLSYYLSNENEELLSFKLRNSLLREEITSDAPEGGRSQHPDSWGKFLLLPRRGEKTPTTEPLSAGKFMTVTLHTDAAHEGLYAGWGGVVNLKVSLCVKGACSICASEDRGQINMGLQNVMIHERPSRTGAVNKHNE